MRNSTKKNERKKEIISSDLVVQNTRGEEMREAQGGGRERFNSHRLEAKWSCDRTAAATPGVRFSAASTSAILGVLGIGSPR